MVCGFKPPRFEGSTAKPTRRPRTRGSGKSSKSQQAVRAWVQAGRSADAQRAGFAGCPDVMCWHLLYGRLTALHRNIMSYWAAQMRSRALAGRGEHRTPIAKRLAVSTAQRSRRRVVERPWASLKERNLKLASHEAVPRVIGWPSTARPGQTTSSARSPAVIIIRKRSHLGRDIGNICCAAGSPHDEHSLWNHRRLPWRLTLAIAAPLHVCC